MGTTRVTLSPFRISAVVLLTALTLVCLSPWPAAAVPSFTDDHPAQAAIAGTDNLTTQKPVTPHVWWAPDGQPLPFRTDAEVMDFLRTAHMISMKDISTGVTRPKKVLLEKDGIRMHAIFRDVSVQKDKIELGGKMQLNFRDDAIFECAAYTLSRMLGLDTVPPVVERRVEGKDGSLQIWLEQTITEGDRQKRRIAPLDRQNWERQMQVITVFDNLIYNEDRNRGNCLIDQQWKLWMIDHTRAFRLYSELLDPKYITQCDRHLWAKLQTLDEAAVRKQLDPYLRAGEIDALLKRRLKLIDHIQKLIKERGEQAVLFTLDR
ncbi:MAG: hypothetical protein HY710_15370 [Candidatus Latescibacteria bacterium]|nr:hypothetical protein [Candidatus Latescibacterota bacterium]